MNVQVIHKNLHNDKKQPQQSSFWFFNVDFAVTIFYLYTDFDVWLVHNNFGVINLVQASFFLNFACHIFCLYEDMDHFQVTLFDRFFDTTQCLIFVPLYYFHFLHIHDCEASSLTSKFSASLLIMFFDIIQANIFFLVCCTLFTHKKLSSLLFIVFATIFVLFTYKYYSRCWPRLNIITTTNIHFQQKSNG